MFSKRSTEIDAALESSAFGSHRARRIAAYNSRDPKGDESPESLLVRWLNELDGIDWPARKINQRLVQLNKRHHQPLRTLADAERA